MYFVSRSAMSYRKEISLPVITILEILNSKLSTINNV